MDVARGAIVIGGSAGAIPVLLTLLHDIRARVIPPVIMVVHRPPTASSLAQVLSRRSHCTVVEPGDGDIIHAGGLYVAPGGRHLGVAGNHFTVTENPPVSFSRPSIDVLFASAAAAFGPHVVAVALTCSNEDGVEGAAEVKRQGGCVIVQDPAEAFAPQLAKAIIARRCADVIAPINKLADHIVAASAALAARMR